MLATILEISRISIEGNRSSSRMKGRKRIESHLFIRSIMIILLSVLFPRGTTDLPAGNTLT